MYDIDIVRRLCREIATEQDGERAKGLALLLHASLPSSVRIHLVGDREPAAVYDIDIVRRLCREIAAEEDEEKAKDLALLLHAVIDENQEEIRVRMAFIAKNYGFSSLSSKVRLDRL